MHTLSMTVYDFAKLLSTRCINKLLNLERKCRMQTNAIVTVHWRNLSACEFKMKTEDCSLY